MATEHDLFADLSITDVVVIPPHDDDSDWCEGEPAGDPPIQLLPDLRLTRLSTDEVCAYERACAPPNMNYHAPLGGGHRYAFVRYPAPAISSTTIPAFDPDSVLHAALAMSRYLVLNSHSTELAARRIEQSDPDHAQIVAVLPVNRFYAWSPRDGSRTHLTQQDAEQLGPLLATYLRDQDRLPPRVGRAIWFCEMSFRTHYYEMAYGHVVTAMESLLKVGRTGPGATAQFKARAPALARELGIAGITRRRAETFYSRRSRSVHGLQLHVDEFDPATRALAAMQRLLTAALRKAIEDREFRALFTGPKLEQRWPVARGPRRPTRAPAPG